jgi:SDR family mycofactocin-dependent oxidoreductase
MLDGRVALITGGAHGQGRSHALGLAAEGADIYLIDACTDMATTPYPMGTEKELEETADLVRDLGRRCLTAKVDVRHAGQIRDAAAEAKAELGRIDILLANAGIMTLVPAAEMTDAVWQETIDINLTGVFNAVQAVLPAMTEQNYGRIVCTSSMAGLRGYPHLAHYVAAKWGVIGLVKSIAIELGQTGITINAVCPTTVDTDLVHNEACYRVFLPDADHPPTKADVEPVFASLNAQPVAWLDPSDVTNVVKYIVSQAAKYHTGEIFTISAGQAAMNSR